MTAPQAPGEALRTILRARFAERLLSLSPRSVLDVGCGAGELVAECLRHGIPARGIEPDPDAVAQARAADLPVEQGDGEHLDCADGAVDWVTLRHVPHHLERPGVVLAEAFRAARTGVLVAEPWFDDGTAPGRAAHDVDRFLKRLDRRRGRFHADVLPGEELSSHLPDAARREIDTFSPSGSTSPADFAADLEEASRGGPLDAEERREATRLAARVASGGVGLTGTVTVVAWKE